MAGERTNTPSGPSTPTPSSTDASAQTLPDIRLGVAISDPSYIPHFKAVLTRRHSNMSIVVANPDSGNSSLSLSGFHLINPHATDEELRAALPVWNRLNPRALCRIAPRTEITNATCVLFEAGAYLRLGLNVSTTILPFEPVDFAAASFAREVSRSVKNVQIACRHPGYNLLAFHGWEEGCRLALAERFIEVEGTNAYIMVAVPDTPNSSTTVTRRVRHQRSDFIYE